MLSNGCGINYTSTNTIVTTVSPYYQVYISNNLCENTSSILGGYLFSEYAFVSVANPGASRVFRNYPSLLTTPLASLALATFGILCSQSGHVCPISCFNSFSTP